MLLLMSIPLRKNLKKKLNSIDEFWCELAMAIGGHTVGELQEKITWREYMLWLAYRTKYGPLNPVRKYDLGFAVLNAQLNNMFGGKAKWKDFIFWGKDDKQDDEEPKELTLQHVISAFGGKVKFGRRR